MIDSREIIEESCTNHDWSEFERRIEGINPKELNEIAERLGLKIPEFSHWRDYAEAFGHLSWWAFTEAYEHITRETY